MLPAEAPGTDVRSRIFTPGEELPMHEPSDDGRHVRARARRRDQPHHDRFVFGLGVGPTR